MCLAALTLVASIGCGYTNPGGPPPPPPDAGTGGGGGGGGGGGTCFDNDGDGIPGTGDCGGEAQVDCDDQNPLLSPVTQETCDGQDNDCDGAVDEDLPLNDHFLDADGDGYGAGAPLQTCNATEEGRVTQAGDCDPDNGLIFPGAPEACNQADDDCDDAVDEDVQNRDFFADSDGDGFGAGPALSSCQAQIPGRVTQAGDCNDQDGSVKPGATEQCNGVDDNCDNQTDDTFPTKGDPCQTGQSGVCQMGTRQCVSGATQCVPITPASAELCDGLDNDCDGQDDEDFGNKNAACTAGVGVCENAGTFVCSQSQQSTVCTATPGQPNAPACDGADNDCDGMSDEPEFTTWWDTAAGVGVNATELDVTPFFYSATGCQGGVTGSGNDSFADYYAAYSDGQDNELWAQKLWGDGDDKGPPVAIPTPFSGVDQVALVQAGGYLALIGVDTQRWMDVYAVGPGPTAQTFNGSQYQNLYSGPSGATVTHVRAVRGHGGRFVVLWMETDSAGSKIRLARFHFTGSGTTLAVVTDTAPMDLVTGVTGGFGVASSIEEYGDLVGCKPAATLANLGVAYVEAGGKNVRMQTFTEAGTAYGLVEAIYSGGSTVTAGEPDVAWAYASGDRWAVVHTVATSSYERVNFWQSSLSGSSGSFGGNRSGNGGNSVTRPRVAARTGEFLVSALVYGTPTDTQVWAGKKAQDNTTVTPFSQVTWASGCTGSVNHCVAGQRRLPVAVSSDSGTYDTEGAVLFATGTDVRAGNLGCN